jgi:hypothetical protein
MGRRGVHVEVTFLIIPETNDSPTRPGGWPGSWWTSWAPTRPST